jgi:glycogenin
MKRAYVTMLCNGDAYLPGVETLGRSLKASGTRESMVVMATADISRRARDTLAAQGWTIRDIEPLSNANPTTVPLFPRFNHVFAKLRAWQLTEFDKVVLLDADTLVLQNVDDLFHRPDFAAAPDFLLPDRFNSGVMVLDPSAAMFQRMIDALGGAESYDGGDQGFLNSFFANWYAMPPAHRLPAGYNLFHFIFQFLRGHPSLSRSLERDTKIIHYAVQKPWHTAPQVTGASAAWWDMYFSVHPEKDSEWKRRVHALEDWTFNRVVEALLG